MSQQLRILASWHNGGSASVVCYDACYSFHLQKKETFHPFFGKPREIWEQVTMSWNEKNAEKWSKHYNIPINYE